MFGSMNFLEKLGDSEEHVWVNKFSWKTWGLGFGSVFVSFSVLCLGQSFLGKLGDSEERGRLVQHKIKDKYFGLFLPMDSCVCIYFTY